MIAWMGVALAGARGVETDQAAPAGLERAYASRRVALLVGIDAYRDPALGPLQFAAKDAADMATLLDDPTVGAYDVVSVLSGEVTREAFWSAFRSVAATVQRDDTLVVYVAGHGTLELGLQGTELFLMPSDGWLSDASSTGIRVEELSDAVSALPARRTVLILDACYSGSGRSVLSPEVERKLQGLRGPIPAPAALMVSEFAAHLYAAHVRQPAIEDPGLQNGVYTHFLLEALHGAGDLDGDGLVEVMEAHGWARDRTLEYTGGSQVPWAETVSIGRQAVYLAGDPARRQAVEDAILMGLESLPLGAVVTVDGVARGAGAVQRGARQLEVRSGERLLLAERVNVGPGERVDLGHRLAQRQGQLGVWAGPLVSLDRQWLGPLAGWAGLEVAPRDPGGPRLVFGTEVRVGVGRGSPTGTLAGTTWWSVPAGSLVLGPVLGAGVAWRRPPEGAEGSVLIQPAFRARLSRTWAPSLELAAPTFWANGRLVTLPAAIFSFGTSFSPRFP
jgi:hypothetical protein